VWQVEGEGQSFGLDFNIAKVTARRPTETGQVVDIRLRMACIKFKI